MPTASLHAQREPAYHKLFRLLHKKMIGYVYYGIPAYITIEQIMDEYTHASVSMMLQQEPITTESSHPKSFSEYCGQSALKQKLTLYTTTARDRGEPLDHTLLFGPPGLGKTTLANIIAHTMNVGITICSGPMMERAGDLVALLTNLSARDVLFIDEIHRMPIAVEEVLYNAMEHFRVDIIIGQGPGAKSVNLPINPFTLIGATTQSGALSAPLRSRFSIIERLDFYQEDELQAIIIHSMQKLGFTITPEAALRIAQASRGTPRIAKNLVRRVRDFAQHAGATIIELALTHDALAALGIDTRGLSAIDRAILSTININYDGGPVGLETLAAIVGEDSTTLEEMYEPYLIRMGYLERTPRGRCIPTRMRLALHGQSSIAP